MASFSIEVTEQAKVDLARYTASVRKKIVAEIRKQLAHQPHVETKNRKSLRANPIATWELRAGRHRVFYEVDVPANSVCIIAIGHKDHDVLLIRGQEVEL